MLIKAHTPKPTTSLPTSSGTETTVETSSVPPNTEPTVTSIVTSIEVNQTETTPEPVNATTTGPSTAGNTIVRCLFQRYYKNTFVVYISWNQNAFH